MSAPSGCPTSSARAFEQLTLPLGEDGEGDGRRDPGAAAPDAAVAGWLLGDRRPLARRRRALRPRLVGLLLPDASSRGSGPSAARGSTPSTCASTAAASAPGRRPATSPISRLRRRHRGRARGHGPAASTGRASERRLVLLGHSTGGLTLSLWATGIPTPPRPLILNSPWLEFQLSGVDAGRRRAARGAAGARAARSARRPQVDLGFYTRAQRGGCRSGRPDRRSTRSGARVRRWPSTPAG